MKKSYCKKCKNFKKDECWYTGNVTQYDSWDEPKFVFVRKPKEINYNNECNWFAPFRDVEPIDIPELIELTTPL